MRYDVKKFLIVGAQEDRSLFFKQAQDVGLIHFIDISPQRLKQLSPEVQKIISAIKIMRGLPLIEKQEMNDFAFADDLSTKMIALKHDIDKMHEEIRVLNLEISRIEVFGDFNLEDIALIEKEGRCKVQFFCAKQHVLDEMEDTDHLIYVGSDHDLDYFMALNKEPISFPRLIEMHINRPLNELKKTLLDTNKKIHLLDHELKSLAKYKTFLHHALVDRLNHENLYVTQDYTQSLLDGSLFAVEGWVPVNRVDSLQKVVKDVHVHYEEIAIEPTDVVPTYLENEGLGKVGEDLVHIYDTPSATDKDPSLWVLFAFALFFAMIVGDAGYGLVFLGTAMYLRYRFPSIKGTKKRVWTLFVILSLACIVWGTMTNSFFGFSVGPDNPIRKFSLLQWLVEKNVSFEIKEKGPVYQDWIKTYPNLADVTNAKEFMSNAYAPNHEGKMVNEFYEKVSRGILFELALFVGVIHLSLSFMRYLTRNWAGAGWLLFMLGGYLYVPYFLGSTSIIHYVFGVPKEAGGQIGFQLLLFGLGAAVVIAIFQHKLLGLVEIMVAVQIFADVLSYLRIYALGIAGAIVSSVINELSSAAPLAIAIVLFLISHLTNMLLSIMGGVIHGLRLNFLEWYHYSFEGRGRLFQPLRKLEIE